MFVNTVSAVDKDTISPNDILSPEVDGCRRGYCTNVFEFWVRNVWSKKKKVKKK